MIPEKIKNRLKTDHPLLYSIAKQAYLKGLIFPYKGLGSFVNYIYQRLKFRIYLLLGYPYFGWVFAADRVRLERRHSMEQVFFSELKHTASDPYNIIEVGSWAGSSAILWGSVCRGLSRRANLYCIDFWKTFDILENNKEIIRALDGDKIYNLFIHNIKAAKMSDMVSILRASSDDAAALLKPMTFDFVYIDSSSCGYEQVKRDLLNYGSLLKVGGILSGDDLELQCADIDYVHGDKHKEINCIKDLKTKKYYHPGITLAINDILGSVSMNEGFWAMRKTENGWARVEILDALSS